MEFTDIFDRSKLQFIIDNFDYFYDNAKLGLFKDSFNSYEVITNKKTILCMLKQLLRNEPIKYKYSPKDIHKKGRLFGPSSLQGISRVIRHTVCKDLCIDIDIKNAHNVFLEYICTRDGIEYDCILYYNQHRADLLMDLMDVYQVNKDTAKRICLSIINGGGDEWFKMNGITPPDWLVNFRKQVKVIHKKIAKLQPERFEKSKLDNPSNPYGTCLNTLLCEMENFVLSFMIEYCKLKNITISTLCFDGILIEKCDLDIAEMNAFVCNHSKIPVELITKEMDEAISLVIPENYDTSDEPYVNPKVFHRENKVVLVKAGLGTGKTTATITYINQTKGLYDKILWLTPRKTYATNTKDRLNRESLYDDWVLYSDKSTEYEIVNKRVVIQCESLHRLRNIFYQDTLIIIDEIEAFLTALTSTETHKRNHERNLDLFESILLCSKIICLDAFLSEKTINIFRSLRMPFFYITYTKQLKQRQFLHITTTSKKEDIYTKWLLYIINELTVNKKRMYLYFSSCKKLEHFEEYLRTNYPEIKYLYYSSKHKENLENVNTLWTKVDVILTTATLTVGVNFDIPNHFHSIGVYAGATSSNLVRDIFQSTYRVRHLIDDMLIFALDTHHYGKNLPTVDAEIERNLDCRIQQQINLYEELHKKKFPNYKTYNWLKQLVINNTLEFNNSVMNLEPEFYDYLEKCNYTACDEMNELEVEYITDKDFEENETAYEDIKSISIDEMKRIRRLPEKTMEQLLELEKFFFQRQVQDCDTLQEASLWLVYKTCSGRKKFKNLCYEKGLVCQTLNLVEVVNNVLPIIANKMGIQLQHIMKFNEWYGVKNTQDYNTIIPHEKLVKLIPFFEESCTEIYSAFDLRESRGKDNDWSVKKITTITNMVLTRWGYSKLNKVGRKKKGKRGEKAEDVSDYVFQSTLNDILPPEEPVFDCLIPHSKKII